VPVCNRMRLSRNLQGIDLEVPMESSQQQGGPAHAQGFEHANAHDARASPDSLAHGLHPVEPCTCRPYAINPDLAAGWAAQGLGEDFFSAAWHSMWGPPGQLFALAAVFAIDEVTCETMAIPEIAILFEMEKET
jgi:hypothetical protein